MFIRNIFNSLDQFMTEPKKKSNPNIAQGITYNNLKRNKKDSLQSTLDFMDKNDFNANNSHRKLVNDSLHHGNTFISNKNSLGSKLNSNLDLINENGFTESFVEGLESESPSSVTTSPSSSDATQQPLSSDATQQPSSSDATQQPSSSDPTALISSYKEKLNFLNDKYNKQSKQYNALRQFYFNEVNTIGNKDDPCICGDKYDDLVKKCKTKYEDTIHHQCDNKISKQTLDDAFETPGYYDERSILKVKEIYDTCDIKCDEVDKSETTYKQLLNLNEEMKATLNEINQYVNSINSIGKNQQDLPKNDKEIMNQIIHHNMNLLQDDKESIGNLTSSIHKNKGLYDDSKIQYVASKNQYLTIGLVSALVLGVTLNQIKL